MATYKGIKGFTIQTIAGDPPAPIEGQVWYNTTSNVLKGYAPVSGAWASGGNLNTARSTAFPANAGTQSAMLLSGGAPLQDVTELYNGTSWTEVNDINTVRRNGAGFGISTAAIDAGGYASDDYSALCESWDGTCWTEVNNLLTARQAVVGCGITTAGVAVGGKTASIQATVEYWDGTSWSEGANLQTTKASGTSFGVQTAANFAGGETAPTLVAQFEQYDGSSWTESADLNATSAQDASGGTSTAAFTAGGAPGYLATTESWNGTSWTEVADLATARSEIRGGGTSTLGIAMSGSIPGSPSYSNATEEWTSGAAVVTFTSS